ncbi:MAG: 50S ribosomal protein L6 [bacterium]|jgi:large subunit ribosomal protein L6
MSRIGIKPITIPANVKVAIKGNLVEVAGPIGTLTVPFKPQVNVAHDAQEKAIKVSIDEAKHGDNRQVRALWGTTRALIAAAIVGVTKGYEKTMEVVGVGWTAAVTGDKLKLVVGFANPIIMTIPKGVKVTVDKQFVKVGGPDKQAVGMFASTMRQNRKPEPYNGKGIKYTTETIKKKAGKAFGSA